MKQAVRDAFIPFTEKFEGFVPYFYLDIKGLVTFAFGNYVPDPLMLPTYVRTNAERVDHENWVGVANTADVVTAYNIVARSQNLKGKWYSAFRDLTSVRFPKSLCERYCTQLSEGLFTNLTKYFPKIGDMCADAQLGLLSMAWAAGGECFAKFPKFVEAVNAGNWGVAAAECHMDDSHNAGLRPRNLANKTLFLNAAITDSPERLVYHVNVA